MTTQLSDYGILYIDDEEKSLKYFSAIFQPIAPIYTASSPEEGYRIFTENHKKIALVLSDKKMPNESGIDLLRRIEAFDARPFRFLVTAYTDLNLAVDALNDGLLYSYLSKPWDPTDLENRLVKAIKHFTLSREKEQLLEEKAEAFRQLSMADRASSIGVLSTGLNHHLRNSLTVLQTFHDILPMQLEEELGHAPAEDSFWAEFHKEVGDQMARMTGILTNLAEGVKSGSLSDAKEVSIGDLITDTIRLVEVDSADVEYRLEEIDPVSVIADEGKIRQMFRVLLMEAKELLPEEKGEIVIQIEEAGEGGVKVTLLSNGTLIPADELSYLFDPFYVRSQTPEKLGVGLLACYLTVANHGGKIRAFHSDDGRNGFEFYLPARPPAQSLKERADSARTLIDETAPVSRGLSCVLPS